MNRRAWALAVALILGAAGCSGPPAGAGPAGPAVAGGPEPATRLTATLTSPVDVELTWQSHEAGAAGRIVEFATEPAGRYTILGFLPPAQARYVHPDLMPRTPFYYRVRAIHGPASAWLSVTLPLGSLDTDAKARADDHAWAEPRTVNRGPVATSPIRAAADPIAGAPTDLKATVMHANGIRFTWTDHASDEEGFLIEVRPRGAADFGVAAVLDPDVNSFGLITLDSEKVADYRIRAFYYGPPSNVAHQTTGNE